MQWNGKLPSIHSFRILLTSVNSKGGNILLLFALSVFFFVTGIKFVYWTIERMLEGKLTADNAIVAQGFNWISGAAFGMVLSAGLKAMTGDGGQNRSTDITGPGTVTKSTSTTETSSATKTDAVGTITATKDAESEATPPATQS